MQKLNIATGNSLKLQTASNVLATFGVSVAQHNLDIPEIQHEDSEVIARDKAKKAFDIINEPVVITDDSWAVPALGGWPGPYMKSMNHWLSAEDFLRLTLPLADRRIILHQYVVFQDADQQRLFKVEIEGTLTREIRGSHQDSPVLCLVSLRKDGRTIAEAAEAGEPSIGTRHTAWHELGGWLQEKNTQGLLAASA